MAALFNSERQKRAAALVNIVPELRVGSGIIERCIFKGILVGKFFNHFVKNLGKGFFNEQILFPNEFSRAGFV